MLRLDDFVNACHETAVSKGWWEKGERPFHEIKLLFISEISEALECVRNAEPPIHYGLNAVNSPERFVAAKGWVVESFNGKQYFMKPCPDLEKIKPEGEAVELADLLVRIGDYLGFKKVSLTHELFACTRREFVTMEDIHNYFNNRAFTDVECPPTEAYDKIIGDFYSRYSIHGDVSGAAMAFLKTVSYFVHRGWDVEEVLNAKMEYNKTRSYRHGGKTL